MTICGWRQTDPRDARMRVRATMHGIAAVLSCGAGPDGPLFGGGGSGFRSSDGTAIAQAGGTPGEVVVADIPC